MSTNSETPEGSARSNATRTTESGRTPERYRPDPRPVDDKDTLYELYWGECLDLRAVADRIGMNSETVREYMVKHGIPRRDRQDGIDDPERGYFSGFVSKSPERPRVSWD